MLKYRFEQGFSTLAVLAFIALPLASCGGGKAAHSGLVPDISGDKSLRAGDSESYDFDAGSTQGYRISYGINWGDGTKPCFKPDVSGSVSCEHAWARPGTYTITATVTDGHGESGFSTYSVQVTPAPPPDSD